MTQKKDPGRFTIRFNFEDPKQRAVVDLLNQQGRLKAQFLTGVVLHYINCVETPEFRPMPVMDRLEIEKIVLSVLEGRREMIGPGKEKTGAESPALIQSTAPPGELPGDLADMFGADGIEAIFNTVAAFQRES